MEGDTQTFEARANPDNTFSLSLDGKEVRLVKEADLLAVKGGSEGAKKDWEAKESNYLTQIAEANRVKDETHQKYLQEQTAREQGEEKAKQVDTLSTKVGELEGQVATLSESRKKLEDELLGRVRSNVAKLYNTSEDTLKDKDLTTLKTLEETGKNLKLKASGGTPRLDDGSGGGSGSGPKTKLEAAAEELAFARKQQAAKKMGLISDPDYQP